MCRRPAGTQAQKGWCSQGRIDPHSPGSAIGHCNRAQHLKWNHGRSHRPSCLRAAARFLNSSLQSLSRPRCCGHTCLTSQMLLTGRCDRPFTPSRIRNRRGPQIALFRRAARMEGSGVDTGGRYVVSEADKRFFRDNGWVARRGPHVMRCTRAMHTATPPRRAPAQVPAPAGRDERGGHAAAH
jgi:hypothetical protein